MIERLCGQQEATITRLTARIETLEERLRKNSANSSQPSSSDGPDVPRPKRRRTRPRRPGGRKGHKGRTRQLLPEEEVDVVVECRPEYCNECSRPLGGADPEPRVEVTEYRRHRLTKDHCGHVTTGTLPEGVSESAFGPRLHALTSLMTGRFLLSRRDAVLLYEALYQLSMSPSSVIAMQRRMSQAMADPVADALEWIRQSDVVYPDETGWRQAKRKAWLWTAAVEDVALFKVQHRRNQEAAKALLGENLAGAACADRFSAYSWIEPRGYCWAHLKRDFQAMAVRLGSERYGCLLVVGAKRVMAAWHDWHEGEIDRQSRDDRMHDERRRIHQLLVSARERAPAAKTRRACAELLKTEERMLTFLKVEGMPPTNNLAERCLRRAVLWRMKCFGTDSEGGSRFVERILSVVTTLQMQERDVIRYLCAARGAAVNGLPAPSLAPDP